MVFLPRHMKPRSLLPCKPLDIWISNNIPDTFINNDFVPGMLCECDVAEGQVLCTLWRVHIPVSSYYLSV